MNIPIIFWKIADVFVTLQTILWSQWIRSLQPGNIVLDVGAYFGGFSLYASKNVGNKGRVICFEPDPVNFSILSDAILKAGCTNVILVNKAVSDQKGMVRLGRNFPFSSIVSKSRNKGEAISIESTTLDDEMKKINIKAIDFIKMNIEGAELEAVAGAHQTLRNSKYIVISSHERNGQQTAEILEPQLRSLGFKTRIGFSLHRNLYGWRDK